jgi:CBS domain-containing protein
MERDGALGDMRVSDIMTHRDKLVTASVRDSAETIMEKMTRNRVRHVPVLDGESLVGIVSIGDMVLNRLDAMQVENESMRNYIAHS